jgi:hypothetical protein
MRPKHNICQTKPNKNPSRIMRRLHGKKMATLTCTGGDESDSTTHSSIDRSEIFHEIQFRDLTSLTNFLVILLTKQSIYIAVHVGTLNMLKKLPLKEKPFVAVLTYLQLGSSEIFEGYVISPLFR